jgi:hypothetical protein
MAEVVVDDEKIFPCECALAVGRAAVEPFATCKGPRDKDGVAGGANIREEALKVVTNTRKVVVNRFGINMVAHENSEKT